MSPLNREASLRSLSAKVVVERLHSTSQKGVVATYRVYLQDTSVAIHVVLETFVHFDSSCYH